MKSTRIMAIEQMQVRLYVKPCFHLRRLIGLTHGRTELKRGNLLIMERAMEI